METVTMFRDSLQIWNRSAQAPRSNKLNLRNPDLFDGSDPAKLHPFLTQCYLHFAERQQDFPEDDDKILFIMSYLRGTAQLWFSPNLYDTTAVPTWDGNFPLFIQELTLNFGPHDPVRDAEDRIRMVRMKQGDRITTYIIEFDQLALLTQWGDAALRHQFYEGLPRRIKDEMLRHTYANTLIGVKTVARLIDSRYWQRELEKQRERERDRDGGSGGGSGSGSNKDAGPGGRSGNTSGGQKKKGLSNKNSGSSPPAAQSGRPSGGKQQSGNSGAGAQGKAAEAFKKPKPYANKLGSDGKLKPEERERRKKLGLCMFCGGNHATDECNKRPGQASGKAASAETASGQGEASGKDGKSPKSKK